MNIPSMPDATEYLRGGKLYRHFDDTLHVMRPWPRPRSLVKTACTGWCTDEAQANRFLDRWLQVDMEPPAKAPPTPLKVPPIPDHPAITTVLELFGGRAGTPERDAIILTNQRKHAHWVHQRDIYNLLQMIPRDVRRIVASFHNRRWQVLNLLANCPGSDELYGSNPAMCYLLTCSGRFRHAGLSDTIRPARVLVRLPQRRVLGWLGFPPTESCRRVLAKIDPMSLSIQSLLKVRDALHNPDACKLLGHQSRINSSIIWLVSDPTTLLHVTPQLLTQVGNDPDQVAQPRIHGLMCDTLRMADQLGDDTVPMRYYSISRLRRRARQTFAAY